MTITTRDLQLNAVCRIHSSEVDIHFFRLFFLRFEVRFSVSFDHDRNAYHLSVTRKNDHQFLIHSDDSPFPFTFDPHLSVHQSAYEFLFLTDNDFDEALHISAALHLLFQEFPLRFKKLAFQRYS